MAEGPAIRSGFMLPAYVREIADTHYGLRALRLMTSELRPENRDEATMNALERALMPLGQDNTARLFRLTEGDYLLAFSSDQIDAIRAALVRLRFLVPDDPLAPHFGDPSDRDSPLLRWSNLENDFEDLRALADRYEQTALDRAEALARQEGSRQAQGTVDAVRKAAEEEERAAARRLTGETGDPSDPFSAAASGRGGAAAGDARDDEPRWRPFGTPATGDQPWRTPGNDPADTGQTAAGGRPIDPDILDRLVNGLARADLSNHVRRQAVCALVGSARPQPLFQEIYVSIGELRDTIAPRVDIMANRWLFQHFTETLDCRVLSWLNREGARLAQGGFSININVETILSDHFLKFEQMVAAALHGTVVLEVRIEDVFSDLEAFSFARDFVRQRGYRLCLDSMSPEAIALLDRERLGADMMKLFWTPDLWDRMSQGRGAKAAARLRAGDGSRTVLARCEDPAALTLGRSLGISMYQGRYIDSLMNATTVPDVTWS